MPNYIDITGHRYGRLTVLDFPPQTKRKRAHWQVRCDCGVELTVCGKDLRCGNTKSCGCLNIENAHRLYSRYGHLKPDRKIDLVGQQFGRLTALADAGRTKNSGMKWLCRCDCGTELSVSSNALRTGKTQSCGCLQRERTSRANFKHGHTANRHRSSRFEAWLAMKRRCYDKKHKDFKNYGARGIKVCNRWLTFANFLADMGERPPGLTLDRINNDGDYEPANCRWATLSEQAKNRHDRLRDSALNLR